MLTIGSWSSTGIVTATDAYRERTYKGMSYDEYRHALVLERNGCEGKMYQFMNPFEVTEKGAMV